MMRHLVYLGVVLGFCIMPAIGRSADQCAVRETFEETGLRISELVPFGFASRPETEVWTYPNGHVCHYFSMMFTTRSFSGAPASDGGENLNVGWFKPNALPEVLPTVTLTIDAFLRWKATGAFQMI